MNTLVRIVYDTNVLVSALVVSADKWAWHRQLWQSGRVIPLASQQTTDEFVRVLSYKKFALEPADKRELLAAYSVYSEAIEVSNAPATPSVRDDSDRPFLELALVGRADALVTGDRDLLEVAPTFSVPILTPRQFANGFENEEGRSARL